MPQLGSVTNPSFAGWQWIGNAGYAFASKWQTPNYDIYITGIHAYFDTYQGNGAIGWLAVWDGNDAVGNIDLCHVSAGVINNGTLQKGGQQWWGHVQTPVLVTANSFIWIGGYSTQGIVWSTYDSNPHTFYKAMGVVGGTMPDPTFFNAPYRVDSGQGPCGAYIDYSQVVYAGTVKLGANGGGVLASGKSANTAIDVGMNGGGILFNPRKIKMWRSN